MFCDLDELGKFEWAIIFIIGALIILIFVGGKHMTKKDICENDCTSFISNGPNWTCVDSCLKVNN